jgi:hypothetical protein
MNERFKTFDILNFERLIETISKLIEVKTEIYELKVKEQMVQIISSMATLILILSFGLIMLFFFSLAMGFYLNSLLETSFIGFVLVGAFYLLIGLILIIFQGRIITNPLFQALFSKTLTSTIHEQDEEE